MAFVWGELLKPTEAVTWMVTLGAVIVLSMVWYTSVLAQKSAVRRSFLVGVHLAWFGVFTWYGWLSAASPFRLHELIVPGLFHGADISGAVAAHYVESVFVYVLLVAVYSGIPLFLLRFSAPIPESASPRRQSARELRILIASVTLFVIAFLNVVLNWLNPLIGWDYAQTATVVGFLGAFALICILAARGSVQGLVLGLAEVAAIPLVWFLKP